MKTVFSLEYNNYLIELKMLGDFIFLYIDNIEQDFSEFERKVTLSYNGNDTIKISLKKPRFHKQWTLLFYVLLLLSVVILHGLL